MDRKEKITGYTGIHSSFNLCNILLTAIKIFISQFDNIKRYSKPITGFTHFAPEEKTNVLDFVLGFCFFLIRKFIFSKNVPKLSKMHLEGFWQIVLSQMCHAVPAVCIFSIYTDVALVF